jgi:hypothetical protein
MQLDQDSGPPEPAAGAGEAMQAGAGRVRDGSQQAAEAAGQEHAAALGLGQANELQADAVPSCRFGRSVADGLLDGPGRAPDPGPVVGDRGHDVQGQQTAQRAHGQVQLGTLPTLGPVMAGAIPALSSTLADHAAWQRA